MWRIVHFPLRMCFPFDVCCQILNLEGWIRVMWVKPGSPSLQFFTWFLVHSVSPVSHSSVCFSRSSVFWLQRDCSYILSGAIYLEYVESNSCCRQQKVEASTWIAGGPSDWCPESRRFPGRPVVINFPEEANGEIDWLFGNKAVLTFESPTSLASAS